MLVAAIADIHGNLEALEAVLEKIGRDGIKVVLCAGDIIGYGANPNECVQLVRERCDAVVMGNHDASADLHNIGYFDQAAADCLRWSHKALSNQNMRYLLGLKTSIVTEYSGRSIYMVHGRPMDNVYEYVYPDIGEREARELLRNCRSDVLVLGHTHMPFSRNAGSKLIVNPGSVGQPRDGNPNASYAIINTLSLKATICRVAYDVRKAGEKIREAGLPFSCAQRLEQGI